MQGAADYLRSYLQMMAALPTGGYAQFLLTHGQFWTAAPCPPVWAGQPKRECFANAGRLALEDESLTYVEGIATSLIPTAHAWCVTADGRVVDPTWDNPESGAYFGIPFKRSFLVSHLQQTMVWGIIAEYIPTRLQEATPDEFIADAWRSC